MPEVKINTAPPVNGSVPRLRHRTVVRKISDVPIADEDVFLGQQVDAYLSSLMDEGWNITSTHFIGLTPQGVIRIMWTMTRE